MNKRLSSSSRQPAWLRPLISIGGLIVVAHETFIENVVRWPLLITALTMMGLVNADYFERFLPGARDDKETPP